MAVGPLPHRINVYRGTNGAKRDGQPQEEVWEKVGDNVRAFFDPIYHYRSLRENLPEELVGREQALVFIDPKFIMKTNDIIVVTNDKTHYLDDKQYDVGFANPASNSVGVHHIEATVWYRDNPIELPS